MTSALTWIQIVALLFAALSLLTLVMVELFPQWNAAVRVKAFFRHPPKTLADLNGRTFLTWNEFVLIEHHIPNIEAVTVVCRAMEEPTKELMVAVWNNFRERAKYSFYVSKAGYDQTSVSKYKNVFRHIFDAATEFLDDSPSFEELFSMETIDDEWDNAPYVFYTFKGRDEKRVTVTLRGTEIGSGISEEYVRVDPLEAKAIISLCSAISAEFGRAQKFGDLEKALPAVPSNIIQMSEAA